MKLFSKKKRPTSRINTSKSPYIGNHQINKINRKKKPKSTKSSLIQSLNSKSKTKPSIKSIRKTLLLFLISALFVFSIYLIYFSDFFKTRTVKFFEDNIHITENLKVNDLLREQIFLKNLLTTELTPLKNQLLESFPEYETINFQKQFPDTLIIKADKYAVVGNFINIIKNPDGTKIQKKFQINSHGNLINENEEIPELPYIIVESPEILQLKSTPIPELHLKQILQAIELYEEKLGMQVLEVEYYRTEREIHLKTEKLFYIWLDLTKPILTQIEKLRKALPKLDIYNTPILYIDLRISGPNAEKIIYKPL